MNPDQLAILIPIIFLLVTGLVISLIVYFSFRMKQSMIQKAGSLEEYNLIMKEQQKKDSRWLLKLGIVLIFFGFGLGFGVMAEEQLNLDYLVPLLIFVFTGAGFVAAQKLGEKKAEKSVD